MTKHTIEIELPDGWEPCGKPRIGNVGDEESVAIWLSVRHTWKWPEWLTAEWIAMNEDGEWWAYDMDPTDFGSMWMGKGYGFCLELTTFTPPFCTGWRQSKRRNPRSKQP